MRRDDAKKLIAALIRRRHNDALRIKRLRSRLICDGPKEKIISSITKDMDRLSQAAYEVRNLSNMGELAVDPRIMKTIENTADQIKKHLINNNYEKASRMLKAIYQNVKSELPEMKQFGGKTLDILKTALNKVSSLKNL